MKVMGTENMRKRFWEKRDFFLKKKKEKMRGAFD